MVLLQYCNGLWVSWIPQHRIQLLRMWVAAHRGLGGTAVVGFLALGRGLGGPDQHN